MKIECILNESVQSKDIPGVYFKASQGIPGKQAESSRPETDCPVFTFDYS